MNLVTYNENLIQKIEEWLEEEVAENEQYHDGVDSAGVSSTDVELLRGRHECAEGLLDQIKKWKKELGIETS